MERSRSGAKKTKVFSSSNSKPPQFNRKKGDSYLMRKMKFEADMVMKRLYKAFQPEFDAELPTKEKMVFDLTNNAEKKQHDADESEGNDATCSVFQQYFTVNKLNCKKRRDKTNWPTEKDHHVMSVIVKKYEPEDTMAKMELERALAKLKLGPKKEPNDLLNEFASIECQYSL
jgi:hypothetical protein